MLLLFSQQLGFSNKVVVTGTVCMGHLSNAALRSYPGFEIKGANCIAWTFKLLVEFIRCSSKTLTVLSAFLDQ